MYVIVPLPTSTLSAIFTCKPVTCVSKVFNIRHINQPLSSPMWSKLDRNVAWWYNRRTFGILRSTQFLTLLLVQSRGNQKQMTCCDISIEFLHWWEEGVKVRGSPTPSFQIAGNSWNTHHLPIKLTALLWFWKWRMSPLGPLGHQMQTVCCFVG